MKTINKKKGGQTPDFHAEMLISTQKLLNCG